MLHLRRIATPATSVLPCCSGNILYNPDQAKHDRGEHNEQDIH
jgi:hypothetical protein